MGFFRLLFILKLQRTQIPVFEGLFVDLCHFPCPTNVIAKITAMMMRITRTAMIIAITQNFFLIADFLCWTAVLS